MNALAYMLLMARLLIFSSDSTASPEIRPIDAAGLHLLIEQSVGKVVVVNMWATWCAPCIEEFPGLLRVRKEYADDGVEFIFVSIDDPKRVRSLVMPFVKRMKIDFMTYIKRAGNDESFINALNPEWGGALPTTFLYDKNGLLAEMLVEQLTYEELESAILPLLKK
ncbi:MAG: TlpA family protein disulfide reductase [Bacteroidota bacterium]